MKENDLFVATKRNTISDDMNTVFVHNMRPLLKYIDAIVSDDRIMNNDIILFTENKSIRQILHAKQSKHLIFSMLILIAMQIDF